MKIRLSIAALCALLSAFCLSAFSQTYSPNSSSEGKVDSEKKSDIGYLDGVVLGLVEGITEFLPVSSTGHLIITNSLLNLDGEEPLSTPEGESVLDQNGEKYSMKSLADAYVIVIQFGAILAVALLYWRDIADIFLGLFGKSKSGRKLLANLTAAFLPAAIIGLALNEIIEKFLFGVYPVIFALAAGAVLMLFVQKIYDARVKRRAKFSTIGEMTLKQSLVVGFLQCVAMWPGTSRSMMTILGGYLAGLKSEDAARFSFLLGLLTLTAASLYKTAKDGHAMVQILSLGPLLAGLLVAFISAILSVRWLVRFLTKRGLAPFAWYRIALALLIFLFLQLGVK